MAKAKQAKETSLPVIVWAVSMTVLAIGLGVFTYVLYSDQEAKDAEVKKAGDELNNARAVAKDNELIARIYRVYAGVDETAGDQPDLTVIQNDVKEGSKPYQELQKLNAAAKARGPKTAAATAAKFDAAVAAYYAALQKADPMGAPPKLDTSALFAEKDFDLWPGELNESKQLKPPAATLLDVAVRSRIARDLAVKKAGEDHAAFDKAIADLKNIGDAFAKATQDFNKKAKDLPVNFDAQIAALNKQLDKLRDDYRKSMGETRAEITKKEEQIEGLNLKIRTQGEQINVLNGNIEAIKLKVPPADPFQYDTPKGKITRRLADNTVEINLGSNDAVQTGLTFTVLPPDFPQKGRQSRMMQVRAPDDRGHYRTVEAFVPKGTIEVTEVLGPDLSRARITGEHNDVRDRVLTGDLLYNSVWRKGAADHIALVGIFDVNGDGTDDIQSVVRDLNRMGIPVDAYFDLKTKKWVGKLTERTRYVVDGFTPVPSAHDANLEGKTELIKAMNAAKDEAKNKLIPVVSFRDFFGRTGYKVKIDVPEERINQAATKYLGGVGAIEAPPEGNN